MCQLRLTQTTFTKVHSVFSCSGEEALEWRKGKCLLSVCRGALARQTPSLDRTTGNEKSPQKKVSGELLSELTVL